tara:strand:- start:40 stop:159 length:120 start_codon:yes stop_codon:yes gene_type:complete
MKNIKEVSDKEVKQVKDDHIFLQNKWGQEKTNISRLNTE